MSRISRWLMCLAWSAMWAWLSGCIGLPRFDGQPPSVVRGAGPDSAVETEAPVESENVEGSTEPPIKTTARRPFPRQGWWCAEYDGWLADERVERGYTIILPGIEGTSWFNISIARGLIDAGHPAAIEINDWTTGYWPMFVYHLMAFERNREQARIIAGKIVAYQERYPGRPVTLIGHSGGAAMAVLVLEALPEDKKVTQAVLLAGALSPDYDLSKALAHTERGISNFYSGGDALYLIAGTLALGTIDRKHSISAGAIGFRIPANLSDEDRAWYESMLHQEPYRLEMSRAFHFGGHFGPVNRRFVAEWVAPRLN
jgi:pimeloyl-ACP methyl ester carboxylesterase